MHFVKSKENPNFVLMHDRTTVLPSFEVKKTILQKQRASLILTNSSL